MLPLAKHLRMVLLPILIVSALFVSRATMKHFKGMPANSRVVQVWMPGVPTSTDPLDYDSFVHHIAFRSVLGSLVSTYKLGGYTGLLADRWQVSEDKKEWRFHIRSGAKFDNGEPISPRHVIQSWKRVAFLLKNKGSHSDLLDAIEGTEKLNSLSDSVSGLGQSGDELVIRLKRPFPHLLEAVSFGLYSIVHSNDYDAITGKWKNPKQLTASNAYRIVNWDDHTVNLEIRDGYLSELWHPGAIKQVKLVWDLKSRLTSDLVIGDSNDTSLSKDFLFYGSSPSSIAFARCFSWKKAGSVCKQIENRRAIRTLIYDALRKGGIQPVMSFFPLGMQGITEISQTEGGKPTAQLANHPDLRVFYRRKIGNAFFESIRSNLPEVAQAKGMKTTEVDFDFSGFQKHMDPDQNSFFADIGVTLTGILVEDPRSDIRFMFLSKEGIRLPDVDGSIRQELERPNFSPQLINQLLWDQAVIFPLGHFSYGVWARSEFDVSQLNTVEPPIEFQWIGNKTEP
jgi:hypothetical protein